MVKLFNIELKKLIKSKSILVIATLMCVLSLITSFSTLNYKDNMQRAELLEIPLKGLDAFYSSMRDMPTIVFLGILVIGIVFCSEFENGFMQTAITIGYSRLTILIAKFFSMFIAYCLVFLPYPVGRLVFQSLLNGFGDSMDLSIFLNIIMVFIVIISIGFSLNCITIILSLCIKKSIFVMGTSFVILILGGNALLAMAHANVGLSSVVRQTPLAFFKVLAVNEYQWGGLHYTGCISLCIILITLAISTAIFQKMDIR